MGSAKSHLRYLLEPTSIAVIGASERPGPGRQVIENLEQLGFTGRIIPVNPKRGSVLGRTCYPSIAAAVSEEGAIDAAAILLGRDHIVPVLEQAGEAGIRGAWAFASGFSEVGEEGKALQATLVETCEKHAIAFCGPNCVGFANPVFGSAAFSAPISPSFTAGNVGAVAQSGSICLALANGARGIGFRLLVSSGNEAVLDSADYINFLLDDDKTEVVLAFIEELRRPDRFISVAEKARSIGKPLVVLKVGRSEIAQRAAVAHTGALAGADAVYDAVFRKHGVIRVHDLDEMMETAEAFARIGRGLPQGNRVGMLTVSGGEISLIGDLAEDLDLAFPDWSPQAQAAFAEVLPAYADIANPLDAWGSGKVEETYAKCVDAAVEDDMDIVVISQDAPTGMGPAQIEQFAAIADAAAAARNRTGRPIVAISHLSGGLDQTLRDRFAAGHVPLLQGTREGLLAVQHLIDQAQINGTASANMPPRLEQSAGEWLASGTGVLDEVRSKSVFRAYGIPCVDERLCSGEDDAAAAASAFGYPVALKVVSSDLPHKTEAGVVVLRLEDEASVRSAYRAVLERSRAHVAEGRIDGVLVQRMVEGAVAEAIVGIVSDPTFGPVVVFGLGGIFVELFKDRALGIPPISHDEAREMIAQTQAARLLAGFRGKPAGDVDALADTIVRMSWIAEDWKDRIVGIDINPLLVLPEGQGVISVDGLVELAGE